MDKTLRAIDLVVAELKEAALLLPKVIKIVDEREHDPRCASELNNSYKCNCWKSEILHAVRFDND